MIGMASNSLNFGSRPLHQINLRRGAGEGFVCAVVSELDPKDAEDVAALQKIAQSWHGAKYAGDILDYFVGNRKPEPMPCEVALYKKSPPVFGYYAVEMSDKKSLGERIVGLLQTTFKNWYNSPNLEMDYVQTKPDLKFDNGAVRTVKGIGEILMAKTCDLAKSFGAKDITIESSNDAFYLNSCKKADIKLLDGQEDDKYGVFYLQSNDFDKYMKYIEQKYQTKF